jgi:hypothetical protein
LRKKAIKAASRYFLPGYVWRITRGRNTWPGEKISRAAKGAVSNKLRELGCGYEDRSTIEKQGAIS